MEEAEETASDWAHFPSDSFKSNVPAEIIASTSMPASGSEISTETYSVSQNENETPGKPEARSEQLLEPGEKSQVQLASDSSAEEDVGRNDVVAESCTESNVDVGSSTIDGQDVGPSCSNNNGSDDGSNHLDFRSQRSRDLQEMPTSSGVHYSDYKVGSFSHRGSSRGDSALLPIWDTSRRVHITLFVIAPRSVEDVNIRPQKVMVTKLQAFGLLVNCLHIDWKWNRLELEISKGSLVRAISVVVEFSYKKT